MRSFSRWQFFSVLILIAGAAWTWASRAPAGSTTGGGIPAPRQGFLAPDFTLHTPDGEMVSLSGLRGRPLLINLWASWCLPCRAEMPAIQRVYDEYRDQGFTVLAINATNQDSVSEAVSFVQSNSLTFPILLDEDGSVSQQYSLRALPTSFFVDSEGVIREVVVGGPMSEALLRIRVQELFERESSNIQR
jgi:peroxiredoxin